MCVYIQTETSEALQLVFHGPFAWLPRDGAMTTGAYMQRLWRWLSTVTDKCTYV